MKYTKKLLAAVMVMVMALALCAVPAFAEDEGPTTYTVTINKNSTDKVAHTYGAYQMFTGDVNADGVLSNVVWGANVDSAILITELNKLDGFTLAANATASDVAKAISDKEWTTDSDGAKALAEALNKSIKGDPQGTAVIAADATQGAISGLVAGYYLVKDTVPVTGQGAETKYILEVVKNVTVDEKASVPTVDKEIAETTPTKVSDYNIGDTIPYTITGTLPSTFASFATYKTFTFTDTLSTGLTPPETDDISVKIGDDDLSSLFDIAVNGQVITVSLKDSVDLKTAKHGASETAFAAGDQIVVSYSATLNDNATIGGSGNVNTVDLQFSNNPNSDGDGDTGTTPPDKTVVFTYEIDALKVEPTEDAAITAEAYNALSETEKANYVQVGDKYQKVQPLAGAGFTLYKADGTTVVKEIAAGETTTFEFEGVDAGTYVLKETTVPSGYDKVADLTITVAATYTNDVPPQIATLTVTPADIHFTADKASGVVSGKILNEKGSSLPSTGGMGTTILYVVGGIMVLIAGVYLITKRRASKESEL